MKNTLAVITVAFALIFSIQGTQAQIKNVWVGGKPGRPIDWNVAANWSLQRVPNEFHDVVIPNTSTTTASYPVIDEEVKIHTLRVESGAKLFILPTGKLNLQATGMNAKEVLANRGAIENQSHNLIGLHPSTLLGETSSFVADK
ncbi:MAG: hypothetical protein KIS77_08790 [Saprospiraceae bacterium]|nr:hypothetical protein [Saprospiraceae bacterium]